MKKLLFIIVSFFVFSGWIEQPNDSSERANAKIKAIYIFNFTKYIEWPKSYKDKNFVIGVVGKNPWINDELIQLAKAKMVNNQKIDVQSIANLEAANKCHIVYILNSHSDQLKEVVQTVKDKSALIITDKPGLAKQGSGINFVIVDNKQKIELNKTNVEKYKLKVAAALENMAIPIN